MSRRTVKFQICLNESEREKWEEIRVALQADSMSDAIRFAGRLAYDTLIVQLRSQAAPQTSSIPAPPLGSVNIGLQIDRDLAMARVRDGRRS